MTARFITRGAEAALLLLFFLPGWVRGEAVPRLSVRLEPAAVAAGRTAAFTVSAGWEGGASELVISRPAPPACRGLSVAGSTQRSIAYREGGRLHQVREFVFTLRGEEAGTGRIGPVRLNYQYPPSEEEYYIATEPVEVEIVSRLDPGPLPAPAVLLLVLAGAAVAAAYVRWMVRRYKNKSNELIADFVQNLENETRLELAGARKHRLEGEGGDYCRKMQAALQDYRRKKLSQPGPLGFPPEAAAELNRLLSRLEEYRFGSPGEGMDELDEIYRQSEILLRSLGGDV